MNLREAAQQALEYLEQHAIISGVPIRDALRAALEPVTTCHELSKEGDKLSLPFNHFPDAGKMVATIRPDVTVDPVAWATVGFVTCGNRQIEKVDKLTREAQPEYGFVIPLYTAPPKRTPLTDEDIDVLRQGEQRLNFVTLREFRVIARAIERAHGIGGDE